MNRYRTVPGLASQTRATPQTLCQKCLNHDELPSCRIPDPETSPPLTYSPRHYSYECKATAQERPYISRPSRTQQLLNPKLAPQLTSDVPNDLIRKDGIADEELAKKKVERGRSYDRQSASPPPSMSRTRKRARSASSDSVSTISTSRSLSPKRSRRAGREDEYLTSQHEQSGIPDYQSGGHKRRHSSSSASRSSSSVPSRRPGDRESNRRRRRGTESPEVRGRRDGDRRGSRRSRSHSRSQSLDKSRIARERKSMTPSIWDREQENRSGNRPGNGSNRLSLPGRRGGGRDDAEGQSRPVRRERSLSPFSKRVALTQAMNISR